MQIHVSVRFYEKNHFRIKYGNIYKICSPCHEICNSELTTFSMRNGRAHIRSLNTNWDRINWHMDKMELERTIGWALAILRLSRLLWIRRHRCFFYCAFLLSNLFNSRSVRLFICGFWNRFINIWYLYI